MPTKKNGAEMRSRLRDLNEEFEPPAITPKKSEIRDSPPKRKRTTTNDNDTFESPVLPPPIKQAPVCSKSQGHISPPKKKKEFVVLGVLLITLAMGIELNKVHIEPAHHADEHNGQGKLSSVPVY